MAVVDEGNEMVECNENKSVRRVLWCWEAVTLFLNSLFGSLFESKILGGVVYRMLPETIRKRSRRDGGVKRFLWKRNL